MNNIDNTSSEDDAKIKFTARLIVKLFNAIPKNNKLLREEVLAYIRDYKEKVEEKGHVAEGFRMLEDGVLVFDDILYLEAVWRGKIETYTRSIKEKIDEMRSPVAILLSVGKDQQKALAELTPKDLKERVGNGRPISEEEEKLLHKLMPVLLSLTEGK